MWLIGYGSLMDRQSAERTLGSCLEMVPVVIEGWQRDFNIAIRFPGHYRCASCRGAVLGVAAADAQPSKGGSLGGMALRVSEETLKACDLREVSYRRVMIPAPQGIAGPTWIYQGLPEHRQGARVVPRSYWEKVARADRSQVNSPPVLPLADLEFIRYQDLEPQGECRCGEMT